MNKSDRDGLPHTRRLFLRQTLGVMSLPFLKTLKVAKGSSRIMPPENISSALTMARAQTAFLNSLNPEQRTKAVFNLEDEQRFDWHFIPRPRKGIPFKELDPAQRLLGNALLASGLSPQGFMKAATIMSLDAVLREMETGGTVVRDSELYYLSIFGDTISGKPWGWRVEGHHLSLNFTIADDKSIATTPAFFGANPAEVLAGPRKGLRTLPAEEDLARALMKSMDDKQRAQALVSEKAPTDILSTNLRKAEPLKPAGLQASRLGQKQQEILMALLHEYATRHSPEIAATRLDRIRSAGLSSIFFAWAGGLERGQAHYYRIQGSAFLIEYDNIQNNANHIHSVWRDFNGDFGLDLLATHHNRDHR
jgi:Protein of unknown function (DUF3500)